MVAVMVLVIDFWVPFSKGPTVAQRPRGADVLPFLIGFLGVVIYLALSGNQMATKYRFTVFISPLVTIWSTPFSGHRLQL